MYKPQALAVSAFNAYPKFRSETAQCSWVNRALFSVSILTATTFTPLALKSGSMSFSCSRYFLRIGELLPGKWKEKQELDLLLIKRVQFKRKLLLVYLSFNAELYVKQGLVFKFHITYFKIMMINCTTSYFCITH